MGHLREAYGLDRPRVVGIWATNSPKAAWVVFNGHERRFGGYLDIDGSTAEISDDVSDLTATELAHMLREFAAGRYRTRPHSVEIDVGKRSIRLIAWDFDRPVVMCIDSGGGVDDGDGRVEGDRE